MRISARLSAPVAVAGHEALVSMSVGIALGTSRKSADARRGRSEVPWCRATARRSTWYTIPE